MRRRILSLLLAFAMVLGMVPMAASADGTSTETNSVTVCVSLSKDAEFMVGKETSKIMAMVPVTVPYFDLANYGLEKYYFVSEDYEGDGSGGPSSNLTPGTSEYADGKVTLLHLYIYITEVFYYGESAETAGSGYLKEEGLLGNAVFDIQGETGSAFLNQFWDGGYNLQYYVNHVYPLASTGWGSTCDQILLHDGDIVTLGNFTSMDFYQDPTAVFNYIKGEGDKTSVSYGETLKLDILRAGKNPEDSSSYETVSLPVTSSPSVYYCPVNDVPNKSVTEWEYLGDANEDGSFTLDTQKLPASDEDVTYMIAIPGQPGVDYPDSICSSPGGMLLTVEAPEGDGDQDSGSNNQPSSNTLNGDTNKNGTVDVTMTISDGVDDFYDSPEQNKRLLVQEMNVPYFDLALYDLERYYYNPDCYTGTSQQAGTAQTAKNVVTTMHAMIWATEVYVLGFEPEDAGKGYRDDYDAADLLEYINFDMDGGVGSTFMKFWNGSTNLNYYLDYAFPLGREGWGSTSDQQALSDGTAINIHLISSGSSASGSNYSFFEDASNQRDKTTVTQGEAPALTLYKTITNYGNATPTTTQSGVSVYYINTNEYYGQKVTEWTSAGTTDESGQITLPDTLEPGTYYVSSLGQDGGMQLAPAAFILTVQKDIGDVILGDVNDNGTVNSADAVLVLKQTAGNVTLSENGKQAADVNGDSIVNSKDAVLILKYTAGTITKFPIQ